jgi:predicted TIM-barrel fold metal-dependent hydrolase
MDRLGIDRSLVWSTQARDHHASIGNRRLLAELDAMPADQRRRFEPSLVISPIMLYERSTADELVEQVRTRNIRALRVFPSAQQFRLPQLEELLERLRLLKSVLFVNMWDQSSEQELLDLADRFKQMPIVCMCGMWPHVFNWSLLNVLARRPNVLLDNSWHHTAGTVERIVADYGSGRMVFATGNKSHNGAAMGHLLGADISDAARQDIAHGNLERILGLSPTQAADACRENPKRNEYWQKTLDGQKLGLKILDAHGHVGASGFWPMIDQESPRQIDSAVHAMDRAGIDTIIVSEMGALYGDPVTGNPNLEQKASRDRKGAVRMLGYFAFNPIYAADLTPMLDDCFSRKFFVGIKFLCGYWNVKVTDPRLEPAMAFANQRRLPVLIHTWDGGLDSPAMLTDIVPRFPDATFLLGHSGGGDAGRREAVELAKANPNVYLEWCGSFCSGIPWESTIEQVGNGRVVFGTDAFGHDLSWELGRFLSLDLPAETLRPILGENMRKILGRRQAIGTRQ